MPADRCPTCDREGCPAEDHWKQYRAAEDAGNYDLAVESLALFDECGCELVDWRARAIAAESELAAADKATEDVAEELETLRDDIAEHLPAYDLGEEGGESEPANPREVVEYAGDELRRAKLRIAQVADELADDLATAQAEIDHAVASPGGMGATLPSMSRLRHGATPTVRVWLGRLVEKLRGGATDSDAAKDRDDARSWRNAIDGAKEPGDPVLRAIAEILSCTYLDAVPTPADDERRRAMAVAAKVANDERRAKLGEGAVTYSEKRDAAKWRRVEPLIERLRVAADADTSDTIHVVDAAIELLAAAKEPS